MMDSWVRKAETMKEQQSTLIVDPLDGTRPFIRGIPTHSVLIALEEKP